MKLGPSITDWLLVVGNALFTATGLVMGVTGKPTGFAVAAFFGGCCAVAIWMIVRKIRTRKHANADTVEVVGFKPLRAPRTTGFVIASGMVVVGGIGVLMGVEIGTVYVVLSGLIGVLGVTLLAGLASGIVPRPFLQFEPGGLRMGRGRYTYFVSWENIAKVGVGNSGGHDVLLIETFDVDKVYASISAARSIDFAEKNLRKVTASNRNWYGSDIAIMPLQFGTDLGLLLRAIERYLSDPSARRTLKPQAELAQMELRSP